MRIGAGEINHQSKGTRSLMTIVIEIPAQGSATWANHSDVANNDDGSITVIHSREWAHVPHLGITISASRSREIRASTIELSEPLIQIDVPTELATLRGGLSLYDARRFAESILELVDVVEPGQEPGPESEQAPLEVEHRNVGADIDPNSSTILRCSCGVEFEADTLEQATSLAAAHGIVLDDGTPSTMEPWTPVIAAEGAVKAERRAVGLTPAQAAAELRGER
jgi:hypothetical protein